MRLALGIVFAAICFSAIAEDNENPGDNWLDKDANERASLIKGYADGLNMGAIFALSKAHSICKAGREAGGNGSPSCVRYAKLALKASDKKLITQEQVGNKSAFGLSVTITDIYRNKGPAYKVIPWQMLLPVAVNKLNGKNIDSNLKKLLVKTREATN